MMKYKDNYGGEYYAPYESTVSRIALPFPLVWRSGHSLEITAKDIEALRSASPSIPPETPMR